MGQCSSASKSPEELEQLRKSRALEKQLAQDQEKEDSKIKLLLLGGCCGLGHLLGVNRWDSCKGDTE